jgi:RNA polymerase sigma-70 factor (ECF subfamily)
MVFGLCRLLLRDPVEAEDAAQQVFLAAHRSVTNGFAPRDPGPWLAAVARNECRARLRSRNRAPSELSLLPEYLPDPVAAAVQTADLDALWRALAELPRRQRKAFLLRELGGLSYRELGVVLGATPPAVESLLFRARRRLRDMLTAANVAAVPALLRDQVARLLPAVGPGSTVPTTAKCAAVAVGVGLGAAGVAELPKHHARSHRAQAAMIVARRAARPHKPHATAPAPLVGQPVALVKREEHQARGRGAGPGRQKAVGTAEIRRHDGRPRGRAEERNHARDAGDNQPRVSPSLPPAGVDAEAQAPQQPPELAPQRQEKDGQPGDLASPTVREDGSGDAPADQSGESGDPSGDGGGSDGAHGGQDSGKRNSD